MRGSMRRRSEVTRFGISPIASSYKAAPPFCGTAKWLTRLIWTSSPPGQASALNVSARIPFSGVNASMRPGEGNSSDEGLTERVSKARSAPWAGCLSKRRNSNDKGKSLRFSGKAFRSLNESFWRT